MRRPRKSPPLRRNTIDVTRYGGSSVGSTVTKFEAASARALRESAKASAAVGSARSRLERVGAVDGHKDVGGSLPSPRARKLIESP